MTKPAKGGIYVKVVKRLHRLWSRTEVNRLNAFTETKTSSLGICLIDTFQARQSFRMRLIESTKSVDI